MLVNRLRRHFSRLLGLVRRRGWERDLDEEIESHLRLHIDENLRSGMSPSEARRTALLKLGGVEPLKESYRDQRSFRVVETLLQDIRNSCRSVSRRPLLALTAVVSLALAIGANSAVFSLVDALLLRPLPVRDPQELMLLNANRPYANYLALREQFENKARFFAEGTLTATLRGPERTERIQVGFVSGNYFEVLGVHAAAGRLLTSQDDVKPGAHPVAVLSYLFWRARFAADPSVIGSTIHVNRLPVTVIGVSTQGFEGMRVGTTPEVRVPLTMVEAVDPSEKRLTMPRIHWLSVYVRTNHGLAPPGILARAVPTGVSSLRAQYREPLTLLAALRVLVLLIGCANVANLMSASAVSRRREFAVRVALGATRGRLLRQALAESAVLAGGAAIVGLLIATAGPRAMLAFVPPQQAMVTLDVSLHWRVLAFTLAVSAIATVMIGLWPAWHASRTAPLEALSDASHRLPGGNRILSVNSLLILAQIALSVVLLTGAGLCVRSLSNLRNQELTYSPGNVLVLSVDPAQLGYDNARRAELYRRLLERIRAVRGVTHAGIATFGLMSGDTWQNSLPLVLEGSANRGDPSNSPSLAWVSPGYFQAIGTGLRAGRAFGESDGARPVAMVDEEFVRAQLGGINPVGRRIGFNRPHWEVVGVVRSTIRTKLRDRPPNGFIFLPLSQGINFPMAMTVHVRVDGNARAILSELRAIVRGVDPNVPFFSFKTVEQQIDEQLVRERLIAVLSSFFAAAGAALAALGVYSVLMFLVTRRRREIGLRLALGATGGDVTALVVRHAAVLIAVGAILGVAGSRMLSKVLGSLLFGIQPSDPATLAAAVLFIAGFGMIASYFPARRAAATDPMITIRQD